MSQVQLFHCLPIPAGSKDDVFELQALRMVLLHNIIIRGFNSLLYYSGEVQPNTPKYNAFLAYAGEVIHFLHHHHGNEEDKYFPFLETKMGKGSMSDNVDGHESFKAPFAAFEDLYNKLRSGETQWDLAAFRKAIYDFIPVLREHLEEEIDTFRPWQLKGKFTAEELLGFEAEMEKHVMAQVSLVKDPQYQFINGDSASHGAWFPPIPPPIAWAARQVLWHVHSDWWQFGCCDKYMKVKPQFAPYEPVMENKEAPAS
ncbi:hypothetical protein FS837_008947 [Tulasnella sp. UAMH 9824]|nr:hypothetical protein FS837_008947 [Tulasnella sp. UAMH 9824]